jgi:hydroxypyruvate isomerase
MLPVDVSLSVLFTEMALAERPAAAAAAGFAAVESWWPFESATPADPEVDAWVDSIQEAGVQLVGLNFFGGDTASGDRGIMSSPARSAEFRENVEVAVAIGRRLGCSAFNALYGRRADDVAAELQDETATENLRYAACVAATAGGTVHIECVSGVPGYPVLTAADAVAVISRAKARAGPENIKLWFDIYHLAANGDDVGAAIESYADLIGHVQIADHPGRHEPGTGRLAIGRYLAQITASGYQGFVGLEFTPSRGTTLESLARVRNWLGQ